MIIEFNVGELANLVEHELTRADAELAPRNILTVWVAPGVFRLIGHTEDLRDVVEGRWAKLPDLPPAKIVVSE